MRKFLFTLLLLLAGYVAYMYFFGKGEDKANAETIVRETKDVAHAIGDFLKRQKDKYDDGEFDRLIKKVSDAIAKLKASPAEHQDEVKTTLKELEKEIRQIDPAKLNEENRKQLENVLRSLEEQLKEEK